ncbi:MAG: hypothetical protein QM820_33425 [Minicystis sp.]
MNSPRTNKLASIFSTLTAAAAITLGASGCVVTAGYDTDPYVEPVPVPVTTVAEIDIDPGATMSADPGNGVGVFVQYDAGGYWTLFTTCDTAISGAACNFDILVSADSRVFLDNVEGFDLEPTDSITLGADGSINLVTDTSFGMNGLTFDADPGAVIEVDVLLDGVAQPQFVYVVSDGRLLSGVPTNPVDFAPAAP